MRCQDKKRFIPLEKQKLRQYCFTLDVGPMKDRNLFCFVSIQGCVLLVLITAAEPKTQMLLSPLPARNNRHSACVKKPAQAQQCVVEVVFEGNSTQKTKQASNLGTEKKHFTLSRCHTTMIPTDSVHLPPTPRAPEHVS